MLKNFVNINLDYINLNLNSTFIKTINNILIRENLRYIKKDIKISKLIFIKVINVFKFIKTIKKTLISRYSFSL